jgi:hypothetical protein
MFLGLPDPDPDPLVKGSVPDRIHMFLGLLDPDPSVSQFKQKMFFVGILKVNDEKSRIRIQDPDPDPDSNPDPLVRGMDPRIRIRIHSKMSWIRNTGQKYGSGSRSGSGFGSFYYHAKIVRKTLIPTIL